MGSNRFNHNKKRNVGLLYEFLIRKVSQSLIEGKSDTYKSALGILKRYFSSGQPLDKERQLFDAVIGSRGLKEGVARGVLSEVLSSARGLDHRLVDIKKSNAIRDVHKAFGKDFFSEYRIADYKAYASVQMLIDGCRPGRTLSEGVMRVQLEDVLVGFMSSPARIQESGGTVDGLTYSLAVKKFNERYGESLSEGQKRLLRDYVSASVDSSGNRSIVRVLDAERKSLLERIFRLSGIKEVIADPMLKKKLLESIDRLKSVDVGDHENAIEEILLFGRLAEEMESDG